MRKVSAMSRLVWSFVILSSFVIRHSSFAAAPRPPNIVLMLVDDLGWADLGYAGSKLYETPNIDRLAGEGMRFTQSYSACTVCSPTRAAMMTGKYPARLHITDWIKGHNAPKAKLRPPDWTMQLPLEEMTIAELCKGVGGATAHLGKWHLGGEGFEPQRQGFDVNLGGDHRGQPPSYFSPYRIPSLPAGAPGEYLTDRQAEDAARFIESHKGQRFFLNLCFYGVHTPLQAKPDLVEKYRRKAAETGGSQSNAVYAAMIESLDQAVGRVRQALAEAGVTDSTVVIFTSDNGGLVLGKPPVTSNAPLRSGKGSPYEGGVRVPLIISWPGVTPSGSTSSEPVITMDIPATIAGMAGVKDASFARDGVSLEGLLRNPLQHLPRDALYWHYPHYHPGGATPYAAIRAADWKLIQYFEDGRHELFNLRDDPNETTNLAETHEERVQALGRKLFEWQRAVGAQWPVYNSNHEPAPLDQSPDGSILLHARDAVIHGTTVRYEPQPFKNTLGYWTRAEDSVSWQFQVQRPGRFAVEILQGCGKGSGGSEVALEIGDQRLTTTILETGGFQIFTNRTIGELTLDTTGRHTLSVKPQRKPGAAVMDLRQVRLVPAGRGGRK
ncbi:MAG: sulfatase-like hydrolase/transferase [Verrucomicrobia bacterium]|nr:sulfatase-like hydrolase/transferase [Verrucomicrobiota bacterium]